MLSPLVEDTPSSLKVSGFDECLRDNCYGDGFSAMPQDLSYEMAI